MSRSPTFILFSLIIAAHRISTAASPQTQPAAPQYHLFTEDRSAPFKFTDRDNKLIIDSTPTSLPHPRFTPSVYTASPNLFILGFGDNQFALWNRSTHTLSPTFEAFMVPIGPEKTILLHDTAAAARGGTELLNLDPRTAQFRTLYTSTKDARLDPAGLTPDGLWFTLTRVNDKTVTHAIVQIKPDLTAVQTPAELGDYGCGTDSVRDFRLLLYKQTGRLPSPFQSNKRPRFEIAVFDISTHKLRALGEVDGGWDGTHNNIIPILHVAWFDPKEAPKAAVLRFDVDFGPATLVRTDNEQIIVPMHAPDGPPK